MLTGKELATKIFSLFPGAKQSEVAALLGLTQTTVSGWLRGKSLPRLPDLQKIVDKTGVTWDDLLGHGEIQPPTPTTTEGHAPTTATTLEATVALQLVPVMQEQINQLRSQLLDKDKVIAVSQIRMDELSARVADQTKEIAHLQHQLSLARAKANGKKAI